MCLLVAVGGGCVYCVVFWGVFFVLGCGFYDYLLINLWDLGLTSRLLIGLVV